MLPLPLPPAPPPSPSAASPHRPAGLSNHHCVSAARVSLLFVPVLPLPLCRPFLCPRLSSCLSCRFPRPSSALSGSSPSSPLSRSTVLPLLRRTPCTRPPAWSARPLLLHACISRRSHFAQGRLFLRLFVAVPWITSSPGHSLHALPLPFRPLSPRSPRCVVATHGGSSISPCVSIPASAGSLQLSFLRCSLPWSPGQWPCHRPWVRDGCGRRSSSALAAAPPPPPPCGLSCPLPSSKVGLVFPPCTGFSSLSLSARRTASPQSSPFIFTTWSAWPSTADASASLPRLLLLLLPRPPRRLLPLQRPPRLLSLLPRLRLLPRQPLTLTLPAAAPVTPHLRMSGSVPVLPAGPFPLAVPLPVPRNSSCGLPAETATPPASPSGTSNSITLTTRGAGGHPCTWQPRGTTPKSFAFS